MKKYRWVFSIFAIISVCGTAQKQQSDLQELTGNSLQFADSTRIFAPWPPLCDTIHVIIDSDAANEVDDQYAIALALGFPERIKIEGMIASHYGVRGASSGIKKSYDAITEVVEKSGLQTDFKIKSGIPPLTFFDYIPPSDGIDYMIERARKASVQKPLWIIALGPATNVAGAILKDPSIIEKIVVFWHGRIFAANFNER